jgi:hypothetical protein
MYRNRARIIVFGLILSILPLAVVAAPAAACHVDKHDCQSQPTGGLFGPYYDPHHFGWIKYPLHCEGAVTVPDEKWVGDGKLFVHPEGNHTRILGQGQRGDTISGLRSGRCYDGTWSNSTEVEHFCIKNTAQPHKFVFRYKKPNNDVHRDRVLMGPGCRWITPLVEVKELTMMWLRDTTAKKWLDTERSGRNAYWPDPPRKKFDSVFCWSN